ncbi:MAG: hypothetical protein GWP75_05905 [Planctomycetia bacterium]|nr:hypothetical protein [Planctomycetia bacterium]
MIRNRIVRFVGKTSEHRLNALEVGRDLSTTLHDRHFDRRWIGGLVLTRRRGRRRRIRIRW